MSLPDFNTYQSPFTWRYGSPEMRQVWSEVNKRRLWRQIWVALAQVQSEYGLVSPQQVEELRQQAASVDVARALQIEAEIHHDLMAELKTFAEQCPAAGGILHLGATSTDIEDNADVLRLHQSLHILRDGLADLLGMLADRIEAWADTPLMAFTHLQPAEPTTLGYRLCGCAQDLLADWHLLGDLQRSLHGKGFKGAVGTAAAYVHLLGEAQFGGFEKRLSELLDLPFFPVTTQTYPRRQDYQVISALAGMGASLYKFAFDLRLLQSPGIGELAEPFGSRQVGSSAMPFKRNPILAEKIDSLGRLLAVYPQVAWQNAAHSLLERTLDDSANRRSLLPETCLVSDELLITARRILQGLEVHPALMQRNLQAYAPFAATERVLMALVQAGADRQAMHARLRELSLQAWQAVQQGQPNPLESLVAADGEITALVPRSELQQYFDVQTYTGIAPRAAGELAARIKAEVIGS